MEQTILDVIYLWNVEARRIRAKKPGTSIEFTLVFELGRYEDCTPTVRLKCQFYDGRSYQTVEAASLRALVEELWHRLGFADREALAGDRVEAALRALPATVD